MIKIIIFTVLFATSTHAQKRETNYEYKKYEKFDLGNLEVKGELLAPGDVSVRERERRSFELDLFERKHSEDLAQSDINSIR